MGKFFGWHYSDVTGGPERCSHDPDNPNARGCPYGGVEEHYATKKEAENAIELMLSETFEETVVSKKAATPKEKGFSLEEGGFYGDVPPRSIQVQALNDTVEALLEDGNTQLVAACGTGKSYMGRQLMRRMMEEPGANGVAIVLTSSVKLAHDTASDLMPDFNGNYDRALGEHGEEYQVQVIEINNEAKGVLQNGAISNQKIAEQWTKALDEGKRVVVVSTYNSANRVQEVQALIGERAEADLLMNDEAHNILGQRRSSGSSTETENVSYRSFANEIPGSIQAKHRLYATATPSLADSPEDDESSAKGETRAQQIAALVAQARKMEKSGKERLTVYSDDEFIVGRVSGAITQQEAIDNGYLTRPNYQLRTATVSASSLDSYVNSRGEEISFNRDKSNAKEPMNTQTYSAVVSTLNAMVADVEDGKNPVHNALAYTGSIAQADAFRDNFSAIAKSMGGDMKITEAMQHKDSPDLELRRKARLSLLARRAQVMSAHSANTAEEKRKAFSMFKGKDYQFTEGWSPDKRVLANVDIFSEGISINEIDTVVIADQTKTSERAMTQAIGRALRTVNGNVDKNTGHVIIPVVQDEEGRELNSGLVATASYGATRVERAVSTRKLKGESVTADTVTTLHKFDDYGKSRGSELAATVAQIHVRSVDNFVASQSLERAHSALSKLDKRSANGMRAAEVARYRKADAVERIEMQRAYIAEQASNPKNRDNSWVVANNALKRVNGADVNTLRQSGRVVTSALGANDFSAVPSELAEKLARAGVIRKVRGEVAQPSLREKRDLAMSVPETVASALISKSGQEKFPAIARSLSKGVDVREAAAYAVTGGSFGSKAELEKLVANYSRVLDNDNNVEKVFAAITEAANDTKAKDASLSGIIRQNSGVTKNVLWQNLFILNKNVEERSAKAAAAGVGGYEIDPAALNNNGRLTAIAQKKLGDLI